MKTRCIHVFPKFKENENIQAIRKEYDYLCDLIEAHITLVFPFKSRLSKEDIKKIIDKSIREFKSFSISTESIRACSDHGYYLFLCIDKGYENLFKLSERLYDGELKTYKAYWTYKPHITIGRFNDNKSLMLAYEKVKNIDLRFEVIVDKLYVEIIEDDESSTIEMIVNL